MIEHSNFINKRVKVFEEVRNNVRLQNTQMKKLTPASDDIICTKNNKVVFDEESFKSYFNDKPIYFLRSLLCIYVSNEEVHNFVNFKYHLTSNYNEIEIKRFFFDTFDYMSFVRYSHHIGPYCVFEVDDLVNKRISEVIEHSNLISKRVKVFEEVRHNVSLQSGKMIKLTPASDNIMHTKNNRVEFDKESFNSYFNDKPIY